MLLEKLFIYCNIMKTLFIVGNWKSYKTTEEATQWLQEFSAYNLQLLNKTVVVCPPFTLLSLVSEFIKEKQLSIFVGSQDVSPFPQGAFTGGVNAEQIKEFTTYAIIGHSERRRFFGETDEMLAKKVEQADLAAVTPVYCVQKREDVVPKSVKIVGYEPASAIGSGIPDTPENAQAVASFVKEHNPWVTHVLYGGSVTPENVATFTNESNLDGVLVGGASLDAKKFFDIAQNA